MAVALALLVACSGEPATPEDRVRATLAAIEAAAEALPVLDCAIAPEPFVPLVSMPVI